MPAQTAPGLWTDSAKNAHGYLFRSMIESGAIVMNGTDPPVEEIDPMASFHCAITRELPDGSLFFPEQRMTREQALRAYTINNAYAAFEDDLKGSLTVGKLADITAFERHHDDPRR